MVSKVLHMRFAWKRHAVAHLLKGRCLLVIIVQRSTAVVCSIRSVRVHTCHGQKMLVFESLWFPVILNKDSCLHDRFQHVKRSRLMEPISTLMTRFLPLGFSEGMCDVSRPNLTLAERIKTQTTRVTTQGMASLLMERRTEALALWKSSKRWQQKHRPSLVSGSLKRVLAGQSSRCRLYVVRLAAVLRDQNSR